MDLIDRQAAIKTLEKGFPSEPLKSKYTEGITVGFGLAITWIKQLPAVQTCEDAVSRAELLDIIERMHRITDETANGIVAKAAITAIKHFRDIVNALPAAQPERKKGKWIERDDGWDGVYYECSVCKEPFTLIDGTPSENLYNFCPNCGADMRGENDDIPIEYFESGGI